MIKTYFKSTVFIGILFLLITSHSHSAYAITNGQDAINLIGQYTDSDILTPSYTKSNPNNGPSKLGLSSPGGVLIDQVSHRLFVVDGNNSRVLIFNLNNSNDLLDYVPDYVLGQTDFISSLATSTQSGLNIPRALALDASANRLFVSEATGNRVKVFDVGTITNGENAVNVLGQTDFFSASTGNSTSTVNGVLGIALDSSTNRLFVAESTGNRVKIFDVATSTITNGENAMNVLGQTTFSGSSSGNSSTTLNSPQYLAFDPSTNRLFVSELSGSRVKVFGVATSTITNGQSALNVLGQTDFSGQFGGNSTSTFSSPGYLAHDSSTNRLFVAESVGNRVKIFDVATSTITNGENASYVLGQTNFSSNSAGNSTSTLNNPRGLGFDSSTNRLYVTEFSGNRVKVFDVATSTITNGENANNLIGQYTDSDILTPSYTKLGADNSPNKLGFSNPGGILLDQVNHRFYISDNSNNRVLAYNLDNNNNLLDYVPDSVLGQSNFISGTATSTQSGLSSPRGLSFDSSTNRLFVAEMNGNRVKIFDVASITSGENAINVLGQTDFFGTALGNSTSTLNGPKGLAFDSSSNRLFVTENSANRVKIFDVATSTITNGENAMNVLGQTDFSGASAGNSTSTLNSPQYLALDLSTNRLFVAESTGHRVKIFDVATSTITNGENAMNVLGQTDFSGASAGNSTSTLNGPLGLSFDSATNRLFVSESTANRVKIFDVATSTITNGENAMNVLGQTDFSGASAGNSTSTLNTAPNVFLDPLTNRLYVTEGTGDRVKVFFVAPDSAKLGFSVQPSNAAINQIISPSVAVSILDASGNPIVSATNTVTISIGNNPGGTLSGTLSRAPVNGVVTFDNLSINNAGTGYTLIASASGLTGATSNSFSITGSPSVAASSGGGGGGGGSANNPTTPTLSGEGCQIGDIFSRTTGARCPVFSDSTLSGCLSGYKFSILTGKLCPVGISFPSVPSSIPPSIPSTFIFTRDLTLKSQGEDVRALQIYLNTHGFPLATSGVGSPGKETNYFGTLTKLALSKFQKAHGINPSVGYFGRITRSYINK